MKTKAISLTSISMAYAAGAERVSVPAGIVSATGGSAFGGTDSAPTSARTYLGALVFIIPFLAALCCSAAEEYPVRLITLDPGHFHAALVQKSMYAQVAPVVHVYAPAGPELQAHLNLVQGYNTRSNQPTRWEERVYTGTNYLDRMIAERAGNVVVMAGNNAKKTAYLARSVDAGFHVLADKPMAITAGDFDLLTNVFVRAAGKGVLLYDIMTERFEISTMLQRELANCPAVYGAQDPGTPDNPSVTKESVHHFSKLVSGQPLRRPPWFFDTAQQGEGLVDVTTHLVDLIQWECFPERTLVLDDVRMLTVRRWATAITPAEFAKATQQTTWPAYLKKDVGADGNLRVMSNGEMIYTLRGVHAKVAVTWACEAPPGGGDTHYSLMRGTGAALIIRQGREQNFKPTLHVEKRDGRTDAEFEDALRSALARLSGTWPGLGLEEITVGTWNIMIPEKLRVGHEAHFAQVTQNYLRYLAQGRLPDWEVPNLIVKYYTTTRAWQMSR
ncbi:MAG: oxidoreductase [Kiritimatiellaeota bacterium]|nr:oxidoreductase [Kiritimatiellota bacterium]